MGSENPPSGAICGRERCYGAAVLRWGLAACAVLALLAVPAGTSAPAPARPPAILITGHGWGHGVGMSQWGAYGYALHGWSAPKILAHYFPGTTLGNDTPTTVHVLLVDGAPSVSVGSAARWRLLDAAGTRIRLRAGDIELQPSLKLKDSRLVWPLTLQAGAAPLELDGKPYRGVLEVIADGAGIDVVNTVSLEQYLPGVVGEEVPAAWPAAALEAQAIAARSYALHQIEKAPASTTFDLYPDGRDQVYGGIDAESPAVRQAVAATARRIVLYDGSVALTYFSSSSGGMTADAADVIGFDVPYLVSVPDPWDSYSPNHEWGPIKLSARAAGKALGLPAPVLDLELQAAPDGRVVSVTATTAKGQVTLTGAQVRDDLKLRSSWFQVALLAPGHTIRAAPGEVPLQADGMPVPHAA